MTDKVRKTKYSVGYRGYTKRGEGFVIVRKESHSEIYISFNGYEKYGEVKTNSKDLSRGTTRNPFYPSVYGVGFTGLLEASCRKERAYTLWNGMLRRCYSREDKYSLWSDCIVCEDWKCYGNFRDWYYNHSIIKNDCLDKDLLIKGNKLYSPETCLLVPNAINSLITNRKNFRGNQPLGVLKSGEVYLARCSVYGKFKEIGRFYTEEEAFLCYKSFKESYIKTVAKEALLSEKITRLTYESILNYTIDYDD